MCSLHRLSRAGRDRANPISGTACAGALVSRMSASMTAGTPSPARRYCRGVPVPVVAQLLGHRDAAMTLRYAHVRDPDVEAAAERIGTAIHALLNAGDRPALQGAISSF